MSISTEIERLQSAKAALKNAINAKGGSLTDETIGSYAEAVSGLETERVITLAAGFIYGGEEVQGFSITDPEGGAFEIAEIRKDGAVITSVKDAGSYELDITDEERTHTAVFVITRRSLEDTDIKEIEKQRHDGEAKTPDPEITFRGTRLVNGVDYTAVYSDNTEIGTASVRVSGIGNFVGTIDLTFNIIEQLYYITGVVTYINGRPAPMVTVTLSGTNIKGETISQQTQTDTSGVYTFRDLYDGEYTVEYNAKEHETELIPQEE